MAKGGTIKKTKRFGTLINESLYIGGEIEERVKSGALKLDFKGHFHGYVPGWFDREITRAFLYEFDSDKLQALADVLGGKKPKQRAIFSIDPHRETKCNSCNQPVTFEVKKTKIVASSKCPHPDGYPVYTAQINVPSGKLIFGNDFRDLVDCPGSFDVNGTHGTALTTKAYADAGMIHVYVGNTCPGLYKVSDSRINIVSAATSYAGEDRDYKDLECEPPKGKRVGGICTDLWWYSAMDYDLFKKRAKARYGKDWKKERISGRGTIVKVKPGRYKVYCQTHRVRDADVRNGSDGSSYCGEEMYSYIKRNGDVRNLRTQSPTTKAYSWLAEDFDRFIQIKQMAWHTIFPSREGVLEHLFLVIGNGNEWSNGRMISVGEREIDAIERYKKGERPSDPSREDSRNKLDATNKLLTEFNKLIAGEDSDAEKGTESSRERRSYYPMSEGHSAVFSVPDDVEPDWLAAVRETLRMVIDSGVGPESDRDYTSDKNNVRLAGKCLKQLEKRFGPELAQLDD